MKIHKYTVYMHVFPNNKKYIGITYKENPNERWKNGYGYIGQKYLYNAIKKYGWDNIEHIIVEAGLSKNDACELEKTMISELNTTNSSFGYNISSGGENGNPYYGKTEEEIFRIRKLLSELFTGKNNPNYGNKMSEESRLKISNANKGRRVSQDVKNKMSASHIGIHSGSKHPRYGCKTSEEVKRKIGNSQIGRLHSEETKEKMSKSKVGKNNPRSTCVVLLNTGEVFDCISEAAKKYNVKKSNISACCLKKVKCAGKHPDTGEKLVWLYYSDYMNDKLEV